MHNKYKNNKYLANDFIHKRFEYIIEAFGVPDCKNVAEHLVPLLDDRWIEEGLANTIAYSLIKLGDQTVIPLLEEKRKEGESKRASYYKKFNDTNIRMVLVMLGGKPVHEIIHDSQIETDIRIKIIEGIPSIADKSALPKLKQIYNELNQKAIIDVLIHFKLSDSIEKRLFQGILRVSDLWFTFRHRVGESIIDDVDDLLREQPFEVERYPSVSGISSKNWQPDFQTKQEDRKTLIRVLSTGSRAATPDLVNRTIAIWYDLLYLR
jgi:hypothetical protein